MGNCFFTASKKKFNNRQYYNLNDSEIMQMTNFNENEELKNNIEENRSLINNNESELSNFKKILQYLEQNTSENLKLLSNDIHHLNDEITDLKKQNIDLQTKCDEVLQINKLLAKQLNN